MRWRRRRLASLSARCCSRHDSGEWILETARAVAVEGDACWAKIRLVAKTLGLVIPFGLLGCHASNDSMASSAGDLLRVVSCRMNSRLATAERLGVARLGDAQELVNLRSHLHSLLHSLSSAGVVTGLLRLKAGHVRSVPWSSSCWLDLISSPEALCRRLSAHPALSRSPGRLPDLCISRSGGPLHELGDGWPEVGRTSALEPDKSYYAPSAAIRQVFFERLLKIFLEGACHNARAERSYR